MCCPHGKRAAAHVQKHLLVTARLDLHATRMAAVGSANSKTQTIDIRFDVSLLLKGAPGRSLQGKQQLGANIRRRQRNRDRTARTPKNAAS